MRNMATIGIDLQRWLKKGLLQFQTVRAFHFGLEMHLARIDQVRHRIRTGSGDHRSHLRLGHRGTSLEVKAALMRLVDFLKQKGITTLLTDLKMGDGAWSGPMRRFRRSWIPGCCCAISRATASATAASTS